MDKNSNIDKLFEDVLGDAQFTPNADSWNNISSKLDTISPNTILFKSRYKIAFSYVASVSIIAIASILLIRSCNTSFINASSSNDNFEVVYEPSFNNNANTTSNIIENFSISNETSIEDKFSEEILKKQELSVANQNKTENITENNYKFNDEVEKSIYNNNASNNLNVSENSKQIFNSKILFAQFKRLSFNNSINNLNPEKIKLYPDLFKYRVGSNSTESSFEISFGPNNLINRTYNSNVNPERFKYLSLNSKSAFNISLAYKFELNKFFLKTGINYSALQDIAKLEITNELNDTSASYMSYTTNEYYTYDTLDYWVDPNYPNDTLVIYKSIYHLDTIASDWNRVDSIYYTKNSQILESSLRYIELPLLLGYRHQFTPRFSLSLASGIGVAVKVGDEGYIVNDDQVVAITDENSPYKNIAYNYILELGLQYKLNTSLSIVLNPAYRRNITSIYKAEANFNSKFESYSLNLGLNYRID